MIVFDKKNKSKCIVLIELYYIFMMENMFNNIMVFFDFDKIKFCIESDKELVLVVKEVIGLNIYNMDNNKLGIGMSIGEILFKGISEFIFSYILGVK